MMTMRFALSDTQPAHIEPGCPYCDDDNDPGIECRFKPESSRFQLTDPVPPIRSEVRVIRNENGNTIAVKQVCHEGYTMNESDFKPYVIIPDNAERIAEWLRNRKGLALWLSEDMSRPGQTLTTPLLTADGTQASKPAWWVGNEPVCVITDFADVLVSNDVEVERFHIAIRAGSNGMMIKVTDGGTRRIRAEEAKAGKGAYHVFDYDTQEAVIMRPIKQVPLLDWLQNQASPTLVIQ